MNSRIVQMIATFHHVVNEQSGNDITIARAKTMVALVSLTWPHIGIVVTPYYITPSRVAWKCEAFDSVSMGGSFRRDPVGDDASIIIDDDEPRELVMLDEMRECALFIPLFGRQRLERFNFTLDGLFSSRSSDTNLALPGKEQRPTFKYADEFRRLREWLVHHGAITPDGKWPQV